jgi:diguanylate cyclase (GGDEF)-like protein/PAS domain S-box-containing protein
MSDRTEMLGAALDIFPDGAALLDTEDHVVFWNRAAREISGYAGVDLLSRSVPEALEPLLVAEDRLEDLEPDAGGQLGHRTPVNVPHKLGHNITVMARYFVLRDEMGGRIGTAVLFHPADSLDALPHGECGHGESLKESQAVLEDRMAAMFGDFARGGQPFGVLWITVDQSAEFRKSHGVKACDAMLEKVEHVLANGLRPTEMLGRWGDDEFLILSHERTAEMLSAHAQVLAGLARTTDFRWWGDRASLTVSIGAAQADPAETLAQLLERAKAAMLTSFHAGGNQIASAPGGQACSPS